MSVSIIIGGQYGSEGKASYYFAKEYNASAVVRVGGTNSGHTAFDENNKKHAFRMLPNACLLEGVTAVLPAGSYIDINVLLSEIEESGLSSNRLKIDGNAVIIKEKHKNYETGLNLQHQIGSTLSGTGAAVIARAKRDNEEPVLLAKNVSELIPYLCDTKKYLRELLDHGKHVIIEGTQGYGLSNYHTKCYPYATSRDTTAAAFLSETGLSPFDVEHIIMVIRSFPIRVAGNSGPLDSEIDWDIVTQESGSQEEIKEITTVTKNVRRVGRFSREIVKEAISVNRPDIIVLNHVDYVDYQNKGNKTLSLNQLSFISNIEEEIGQHVDYCGNGENVMIYVQN